jgi:hypothetical protein
MRFALLFLLLISAALPAAAQSAQPFPDGLEYDIGLDCPLAQTLDAESGVLWVLMEGCFTRRYTLQAFDVATGARLETASDYAAQLELLRDGIINRTTHPLALVDDVVTIRYADAETYVPLTIAFTLDDAPVTPALSDADLSDLLFSLTDYPETTVYSPDHAYAAVIGTNAVNLLDIANGQVLFTLPMAQEYNAFPTFSADSDTLYMITLDEFDNMDNYASTLTAYSIPTGERRMTAALPSFSAWVSPDERYAAVQLGTNDGTSDNLYVVDLTSGAISEPFSLYEPPSKALTCVNDGRSLADVDFTRTGRLRLTSVDWLPDSSGFVFTRSYGGEGAGGGRPCVFDTSRLNVVTMLP